MSLGKSSVKWWNNNINFSISITYSIFLGVTDITLKLNLICIGVFEAAPVLPLLVFNVLL